MAKVRVIRVRGGRVRGALNASRVAALGSFDGIHLGHKKVLEIVKERAEGENLPSALITFYPHPSVALGKTPALPCITTLRQKCEVLQSIGIDELILVKFSPDLAQQSYQEFVKEYLVDRFQVKLLVIGPDARVGKRGEGTADKIKDALAEYGRAVEIVPFEEAGTKSKIGSRAIRDIIHQGRVEATAALLGRRYSIEGRVISGDGRGRTIGFPTANLYLREQAIPKNGVYAGWASVDGHRYPAVSNIGIQPTFNGESRRVEVHLLEYPGTLLYKKRLTFEFVVRLRDEERFSSVDELKKQIQKDIYQARLLLLSGGGKI